MAKLVLSLCMSFVHFTFLRGSEQADEMRGNMYNYLNLNVTMEGWLCLPQRNFILVIIS